MPEGSLPLPLFSVPHPFHSKVPWGNLTTCALCTLKFPTLKRLGAIQTDHTGQLYLIGHLRIALWDRHMHLAKEADRLTPHWYPPPSFILLQDFERALLCISPLEHNHHSVKCSDTTSWPNCYHHHIEKASFETRLEEVLDLFTKVALYIVFDHNSNPRPRRPLQPQGIKYWGLVMEHEWAEEFQPEMLGFDTSDQKEIDTWKDAIQALPDNDCKGELTAIAQVLQSRTMVIGWLLYEGMEAVGRRSGCRFRALIDPRDLVVVLPPWVNPQLVYADFVHEAHLAGHTLPNEASLQGPDWFSIYGSVRPVMENRFLELESTE
ncbi:uncharacterized protein BXZ73DRAFT_103233 [Epithele typhae]|uniref:uncharacterized protein n=1 Tax=Epithele typhae TaxID=378194 RepID=UPI00200778D1|nr:uncharacterized protein BXZ73DRAFT_104689 [Epithele typhae]XP_047875868.1 uncharacterized protein BXZ73DRAFT_103233 [Epithele typhae]KAH9920563.1 hypothetical protein BXZ73DRAFT_104689 [Epithele typhae]KAH9925347.1 hypothetical protein BXZ73DRAFT_103233 [Epithele typhae]